MRTPSTPRAGRRPWFLAIAVLVSLIAAACGSSDDSSSSTTNDPSNTSGTGSPTGPASGDPLEPQPLAEPSTIKLTTPAVLEVFAQPMLADVLGELEKENLSLDVTTMPTSEALALLNAGDTDVHITSPIAGFFNAVNQGLDLRWAAATNQFGPEDPTGLYLRPELFEPDGTVDPESLRGARISLGPSGWGDLAAGFFKDWLDEHGLSTDDIDIRQFTPNNALSQLENDALDGAVLAPPIYQQAIEGGFAELFLSFPEGSTFNGFFVGPNLLEDDRAVGEAFFRAVARTTEEYLQGDYHDDPEVVQAIAEVVGAPAETVTATEPLLFDPSLALDPSWAQQTQEAWLEIGGILSYDEPIPVEDWVDTSLIEPLASVQ